MSAWEGGLGVALAWEKGHLMSGRSSKGEHQERHATFMAKHSRNMLLELYCLLPGLPAMLRAIFSLSVRKEMAA